MSGPDLARLRRLFDEAIGLPPEERAGFLARACRGDEDLRRTLEHMLATAEGDEPFLSEPTGAPDLPKTISTPPPEQPGTRIGPYKLLELIGEGGFGTVFLAEQTEPLCRRVALKIIKLGMDTRQVVARFEQERQALALMDHPSIARVLDAGATESGRPYFVMELVRGEPITAYCDSQRLSLPERLELFGQVCGAVQHAHQKGIIHRDLKPSNVLVTVIDGRAVPKVIDFGIAKATSARLTDKTLFTEHRALIGTPAYMSPEQAELSGVDVDTRSDIYSLGVLLYELLTGVPPFDPERLRSAAYEEMRRIIREQEPPKPSTRLWSGGQPASRRSRGAGAAGAEAVAGAAHEPAPESPAVQDTAARLRRTDPGALVRAVRGDLDWIVMRCLEKERARRYETASALAQDVQRHLRGEPVLAAPPSAGYRLRKFVRRHRVGVGAGAAVAGALVLGLGGTTAGFLKASLERDRAVVAQGEADSARRQAEAAREAESAQRRAAEESATTAAEVTRYIEGMLASADPHEAPRGPGYTVREMLDTVAGELGTQLRHSPKVEAAIRITLAYAYINLGQSTQAADHAACAVRAAESAGDAEATELSRMALASAHHARGDFSGAEALLRRSLFALRSAPTLRGEILVDCLNSLSDNLRHLGRFREAADSALEAVEVCERLRLGETSTASALKVLADVRGDLGDLAASESLLRRSLALQLNTYTRDHPAVAATRQNLSGVLVQCNRLDEAHAILRELLDSAAAVYRADHPHFAALFNNMASIHEARGERAEAIRLRREALRIIRLAHDGDHPHVAVALGNLGRTLAVTSEAEALLRESLAMSLRLGLADGSNATRRCQLAAALRARGQHEEAERLLREAIAEWRRLHAGDHPDLALGLLLFGEALRQRGDLGGAEPLLAESLAMARRLSPNGGPGVSQGLHQVAALLEARGDYAGALPLRRERLDNARHVELSRVDLAGILAESVRCLVLIGTPECAAEAVPLGRECLDLRDELYPAGHPESWKRFNAMVFLGAALQVLAEEPGTGAADRAETLREAERLLVEGYTGLKDDASVPRPPVAVIDPIRFSLERIVRLYKTWHTLEPTSGFDRRAEEWRKELENGP